MTHGHGDAAQAAEDQRSATVIGWVGGTPIARATLDERVAELRAGRFAGRLPAVGSKEDRQFLRWTAQVLLTEELCRVESARLGLDQSAAAVAALGQAESARPGLDQSAEAIRPLSQAESLHLGSINAAAWSTCSAVSVLFEHVTAPTVVSEPPPPRRTWYRVTHAVGPTPHAAGSAKPRSLGWTTLADLPVTLAAELRAMPTGIRVGPIRSGIGWHFATVTATEVRADPWHGRSDLDPPRLVAFNRWLDERRRALVRQVPGFEHPGDPSQPDNTHRH